MKSGYLRAIWFAALLFFGIHTAHAQQLCRYEWAKRISGLGSDEGRSVATDQFGNVYVTGRYEQEITFGTQTLTARGGTDIFLVKYDNKGSFVWARSFGGRQDDGGTALYADPLGNLYLTGYFSDRGTFGSFTLLAAGESDIFLLKLNSNGTAQYAKRAGSTTADFGTGITVDNAGFILVTGSVSGESSFTGTTLIKPNVGAGDIFIAKYNNLGNVVWANIAGSTLDDETGRAVAVDANNNVFLTGSFRGQASFGTRTQTSLGGSDIFIARIDASGNFQWVEKAGGALDDAGFALTLNPQASNIFLSGIFRDNALFGTNPVSSTGGSDAFLARYDGSGQVTSVTRYGSIADDAGTGMARDTSGKVYLTGWFGALTAFGTTNLLHQGGRDVFTTRFDANGNLDWVYTAGGSGNDEGAGIASSPDGQIYITGYFNGTAAFDNIALNASSGQSDPFTAKLCNFTPRFCDMTITVETKNETFVRNDGAIIVKSVTGVPEPYGYSLDKITFQTENTFANLKGGDYTVYVQNASGCSDSIKVSVTDECAKTFGAKFVQLDSAYCSNYPGGIPLVIQADAGVNFQVLGFTGTGVSNGIFTPSAVGTGTTTITAAVKFDETQCTVNIIKTVSVEPNLKATITGLDSFYCWSESRADRLTGSPAGGVFAGPGIEGNIFRPGSAGIGTHQISYFYTGEKCTYVATKTVIVGGEGNAEIFGLSPDYCTLDGASVQLFPSPPGGKLVGAGLGGDETNGYFYYPASLGKGTHQLTYYGQASDGCPFLITRFIEVHEPPVPTIKPYPAKVCFSAPNPITFEATPANGFFAGPGVIGNQFFPSSAGIGLHKIIYVGTENGCNYAMDFFIEVTTAPNASIIGLPPVNVMCNKDVNYPLRGFPSGGTFTINGQPLPNNTFNAFQAGPGQHLIRYVTDSNNCVFSKDAFIIVEEIVASIGNLNASYCENDPEVRLIGKPYGGFFNGPGVLGDLFIPSFAGPGTYLIEYSGDSAGCFYTQFIPVTIFSNPTPQIFGLLSSYCLNDFTQYQLFGDPVGGTFSGPGMNGDVFTPANVGTTGDIVIEYSGMQGDCEYSIKDTISIISRIVPTVTGFDPEYCVTDNSLVTLTATPPGGVLLVNGVETNSFRPSDFPVGAVFITYAGEEGGCEYDEAYSFIIGFPIQPKFVGLATEYCSKDNTPFVLKADLPGGTFSGIGVVDGVFYPNLAGAGLVDITYSGTYKGCFYSINQTVAVLAVCCPTPDLGRIVGISTQAVRLNWFAATNAVSYELQFRKSGETNWVTYDNIRNTFLVINNLESCQGYEFRVRSLCINGFYSDFTPVTPFSPLGGTCTAPEDLEAVDVQSRSATLTWARVDGACPSYFRLEYREIGATAWSSVNVFGTEATITGLKPNTTYLARVILRCDSLNFSLPSSTITFTTPAVDNNFECKIPDDFQLIALNETEAQIDWLPVGGYKYYEVSYRTMSDPTNWITIETPNSDFTIISLQPEENYEVRVRTFCVIGGRSDYSDTIRFQAPPRPVVCQAPANYTLVNVTDSEMSFVWDFNPNAIKYVFEFRPVGNFFWYEKTVTQPTVTVFGLNPFMTYETRVRAFCTNDSPSDYSLLIPVTPRANCEVPQNFKLTDMTSLEFSVTWDATPNAVSYRLEYRQFGNNAWIPQTVTTNFITINNLNPYFQYEVRVRALCSGSYSGYSNVILIPVRELCAPPIDLLVETPDPNTATLMWFGSSQAIEYDICWRLKGSNTCFETFTVTGVPGPMNFNITNGLDPDTDYEVTIRARCAGDVSELKRLAFSTPDSRKDLLPTQFDNLPGYPTLDNLSVYPNPNKGAFAVKFRLTDEGEINLKLIDARGKTLIHHQTLYPAGNHEQMIDGLGLTAGVYMIRLQTGTSVKVLKVVIE